MIVHLKEEALKSKVRDKVARSREESLIQSKSLQHHYPKLATLTGDLLTLTRTLLDSKRIT